MLGHRAARQAGGWGHMFVGLVVAWGTDTGCRMSPHSLDFSGPLVCAVLPHTLPAAWGGGGGSGQDATDDSFFPQARNVFLLLVHLNTC